MEAFSLFSFKFLLPTQQHNLFAGIASADPVFIVADDVAYAGKWGNTEARFVY